MDSQPDNARRKLVNGSAGSGWLLQHGNGQQAALNFHGTPAV